MRSYRLLLLDKNGRLIESIVIACVGDQEAIAVAEREARRCEYVEVWNGGHPVGMYARPRKQRAGLEALLRSWRSRHSGPMQRLAAAFATSPESCESVYAEE